MREERLELLLRGHEEDGEARSLFGFYDRGLMARLYIVKYEGGDYGFIRKG